VGQKDFIRRGLQTKSREASEIDPQKCKRRGDKRKEKRDREEANHQSTRRLKGKIIHGIRKKLRALKVGTVTKESSYHPLTNQGNIKRRPSWEGRGKKRQPRWGRVGDEQGSRREGEISRPGLHPQPYAARRKRKSKD